MKKWMIAAGLLIAIAGCNSSNDNGDQNADSSNVIDGNKAPMGDTANQINTNAGNYPDDTSNQNGDDSVKGTHPSSRNSTPRNPGTANQQRKQ